MVNWSDPDIIAWKDEATRAQQDFCELLGDRYWDVVERNDWTSLRRKVGYGLYGPPPEEPTAVNKSTGYKIADVEKIDNVCNQLVADLTFDSQNIHFACVFVIAKAFEKKFTDPIFRVKGENAHECKFVDSCARVYSSWSNYLSENVLPKCLYCYPENGIYEYFFVGQAVVLGFGTSPACNLVSQAGTILDKVAAVATLGATGVGIAALFSVPILGPIAVAATTTGISTGIYGIVRSSHALYDRRTHGQSIGLGDSDARMCWLSIVGSSLGFAHGSMISSITQAARAGDVMSTAGRIAFMVVQTGSLTVNGLGIINGLVALIDKYENQNLTALDVFQFSASVLFFSNSAINAQSATTIIQNVQNDVIGSHRDQLHGKAKKLFNRQTRLLRGRNNDMQGNARVVKQLSRIDNTKQLYEMMVDRNVDNRNVRLYPDGFRGNLVVNGNLKVHPLKLAEIPPQVRQEIYTATSNYLASQKQDGNLHLDKAEFMRNMKAICSEYRITFESMRSDTKGKICQMFGKNSLNEIQVNGRKIFDKMTPHELDRMAVVLANSANNDADVVCLATTFAETDSVGCRSVSDYISRLEYFVAEINDFAQTMEKKYQMELTAAKEQPHFNLNKFNREFGIEGERRTHFRRQVLKAFSSGDGTEFANMAKRYNDLKSEIGLINRSCQLGFFNDDKATYHYLKHKDFGSQKLTPEQYLKIAQEVTSNPVNQTNSIISADGSVTYVTYVDPKNQVVVVKIDCNYEQKSGIATVYFDPRIIQE